VDLARGFLDENFMRTVTSEELEAVTGLDRYALARHFRIRLGTSPYRYLTMRRLDRAKSVISAGRSLVEAAVMSGFADQSHMTRQFKRAFGLTPGRWRGLAMSSFQNFRSGIFGDISHPVKQLDFG
jgi:AraC-like DNA-binding protein